MPWPAYGKLLAPLKEQPQKAAERTSMERGPAKQRRMVSLQPIHRTVKYQYTAAEFASWLTWYRTTINYGVDFFDWDDPRDGVTKQARIVGGAYSSESTTISPGAPLGWIVELTLETLE
jgi:hypothetical protein